MVIKRAVTGSIFLGCELFQISNFGLGLGSGIYENWLKHIKPLKFFELFLSLVDPTLIRALSSLPKKLTGLVKIWAW